MPFFTFTQPPKVLAIAHHPGKNATRATIPLNTTHVSSHSPHVLQHARQSISKILFINVVF